MIDISYFESEIAGRVYLIREDSKPLISTVWRIANTSCNGGCRENREVVTFKNQEQWYSYASRLHITTKKALSYVYLDGEITGISDDGIELLGGEYLFEGLATTLIHPLVSEMLLKGF